MESKLLSINLGTNAERFTGSSGLAGCQTSTAMYVPAFGSRDSVESPAMTVAFDGRITRVLSSDFPNAVRARAITRGAPYHRVLVASWCNRTAARNSLKTLHKDAWC